MDQIKRKVEEAFENRSLLSENEYRDAVLQAVRMLDQGEARVAEPGDAEGGWVIHGWLQQACIPRALWGGLFALQSCWGPGGP